jgi:hypothetical protein
MPRPETVDPIYDEVIKYLKEECGIKKLGGVGYCFGGKYVCRFLTEGSLMGGGLDAGFTAHPSFVDADEVRNIRGPLSIAAAGTSLSSSSPLHSTSYFTSLHITSQNPSKMKDGKRIANNAQPQKPIPSSPLTNATKQKTYSSPTPCPTKCFSTLMLSMGLASRAICRIEKRGLRRSRRSGRRCGGWMSM